MTTTTMMMMMMMMVEKYQREREQRTDANLWSFVPVVIDELGTLAQTFQKRLEQD